MFFLREYHSDDAGTILGWINNEKTFRQWSADKYDSYPVTPEDMNSFYDEIIPNGAHPFVFCEDDTVIGHFILRPLPDEEVKTVRIGFIIVDNSIRGKGYGRKMLETALKYAFETFACARVTLGVFENNPKAKSCYESVGFRQCGEEKFCIDDEEWKCLEMEYRYQVT